MAGSGILYFDYAANLRRDAFDRRIEGSDWLGVARLEDHRLVIAGQGQASAEPAENASVWGALWLLPATQLPWLDEQAGVPAGRCVRTTARVVTPAGPRAEAMLYRAASVAAGSGRPGDVAELLAAAKSIRLPATYLAEIAALA